jgi:hypothetical protein
LVSILVVAGIVGAPDAAAGLPPGYYVDAAHAGEARPTWRDRPGDAYTYSIRREFPDSTAGWLLGIAEAIYPPRALMVTLAVIHNRELGPDTTGTPLWWCDGPGLRRVPYAVTARAYEHYAALIDDLKDRTIMRPGTPHPLYAGMQYRATIAERDGVSAPDTAPRKTYVAYLSLLWSYDDGVFFTSFEADRTVVLHADGEVVSVGGDGRAREEVSPSQAIGHRRGLSRYR